MVYFLYLDLILYLVYVSKVKITHSFIYQYTLIKYIIPYFNVNIYSNPLWYCTELIVYYLVVIYDYVEIYCDAVDFYLLLSSSKDTVSVSVKFPST